MNYIIEVNGEKHKVGTVWSKVEDTIQKLVLDKQKVLVYLE